MGKRRMMAEIPGDIKKHHLNEKISPADAGNFLGKIGDHKSDGATAVSGIGGRIFAIGQKA